MEYIEIRARWRTTTKNKSTETHRLVWRNATWQYLSEPLEPLTYSTRDDETYARVTDGELIAQHHNTDPIHAIYIVQTNGEPLLRRLQFQRTQDRRLLITTPDGQTLTLPDPTHTT
jgi:hypothetical protein